MPTGPKAFFWICRARVGSGPAPGPTKKGLVPHMPVGWGGHQIAQINIGVIRTVRDFLPFYVTLSFLRNIICYLISVFVFSLVTLSGVTTITLPKSALQGWGVRTPNECPDMTWNHLMVRLQPWRLKRMQITPSLLFLPDILWPGVIAPDRVLSISQLEQTICKQMTDVKLWRLYSTSWNHLTVCKKELRLV